MCSPTESIGIQRPENCLFKKILRKLNVTALVFFLAIMPLTACEEAEIVLTTEFEEGELMRINTLSCYMPEMMLYLINQQNEYEAVYGSEIWEKTLAGEKLSDSIKDLVLAKIAQVKVMNLMAVDYGIELTPEENEAIKESAEKYYKSLTKREIAYTGATVETVATIYKEYVTALKVYDYIIRDINPEISDDEARTIMVEQILIKTYALDGNGKRVEYSDRAKDEAYRLASEIREKAVNEEEPVDFEVLAAEYNEGDAITYSFGRGEMAEAFEEAAFNLDNGEISEIVETEYGYHIIKCVSTFDIEQTQANKVAILKERKDKVFEETYNGYLPGLKKNLNKSLYESIEVISDEGLRTSDMFSEEYVGGL